MINVDCDVDGTDASSSSLPSSGGIPRLSPQLAAAVRASGCLAAASLANHHGCAFAVVRSGAADALVDLLMPAPVTSPASGQRAGALGATHGVILGAAAACVARCAELPQFAARIRKRGLVERLEGLVEDMADNESFCESAGAAITAIQRFAPIAGAVE